MCERQWNIVVVHLQLVFFSDATIIMVNKDFQSTKKQKKEIVKQRV